MPPDLGVRLESVGDAIAVESAWVSRGMTQEDSTIEEIEPALCAYNPRAGAKLICHIVSQAGTRERPFLWSLAVRLREHSLTLGPSERESVLRGWEKFQSTAVPWNGTEQHTESFLLRLLLEDMEAEHQLSVLRNRPREARDLLAYENSFRCITNWEVLQEQLSHTHEEHSLGRTLWFLGVHAKHIPPHVLSSVTSLVTHDASTVRRWALRILYERHDETSAKPVVDGSWAWHSINTRDENHYGSLLLCKFGKTLPYEEVRMRVHPAYLGYAVQERGSASYEVHQYAEDIHHIWDQLGRQPLNLSADYQRIVLIEGRKLASQGSEETQSSTSAFARSALSVYRKPFWQGSLHSDFDRWREQSEGKDQDAEQLLLQRLRQMIEEQQQAGNFWFGQRFSSYVLSTIVTEREDLVTQWLEAVLTDEPEAKRRMLFGHSFYDTLCRTLLRESPEKGCKLYRRLQDEPGRISTIQRGSEISVLLYALFEAPATQEVCELWGEHVEQCRTDRELMSIAIAAQAGNGREWLWSWIAQRTQSPILFEQARAYILAAFIDEERAEVLLRERNHAQPDTWIGKVASSGLQYWITNSWAQHWYRRFLSVDEDVSAWAAFRLFLQCVDSRFWLWRHRSDQEDNLREASPKRWVFLENNRDTIDNCVRKNEKALTEHFLAQKVLRVRVWPWA